MSDAGTRPRKICRSIKLLMERRRSISASKRLFSSDRFVYFRSSSRSKKALVDAAFTCMMYSTHKLKNKAIELSKKSFCFLSKIFFFFSSSNIDYVLTAMRSLALRARGLLSTSSRRATRGFFVRLVSSELVLKNSLTMRSSNE